MSYFAPYEGGEPYIFVSYAHIDSPEVMRVISDMHDKGYRIWYDEGIEVGSEWPECIAEHLSAAHLMLAFISDAYMKSDNCRREMHYALSKRIKVINVFLEQTEMTPGMEMQIGNIFALMKYTMPEDTFFARLYSTPLLNSEGFSALPETARAAALTAPRVAEAVPPAQEKPERAARSADKAEAREKKHKREKAAPDSAAAEKKALKKRRAGRIGALVLTSVLFVGAITMGIIGHFLGWNERLIIRMNTPELALLSADTKAQFTSDVFEAVVREYTGIDTGDIYVSDLTALTELYIAGNSFSFESDPAAPVYGLPEGAQVRELSDLCYFTGLRTLSINAPGLSSLSTMPALPIQYLSVGGCRVATLDGVGKLTKLRELRADGCPVVELGDISQCLELRVVDLTGAVITDYSAFKPLTKLSAVALSNCTTDEMKPVLRLGSLTDVRLSDCDLRGSFFKSFDRESAIVTLVLENCILDSTANLDDFSSLTSLTLINSGAALDWAQLQELPALSSVTADNAVVLPELDKRVSVVRVEP